MKPEILDSLKSHIASQDDVLRLVRLVAISEDQARYLVETPFSTFPRFVIGTTDAKGTAATVVFSCGLESVALKEWDRLTGRPETTVEGTARAGAIRHNDGHIERRVMLKLPGMGEYVMTPNFARQVADVLQKCAEKADNIQPWELDE